MNSHRHRILTWETLAQDILAELREQDETLAAMERSLSDLPDVECPFETADVETLIDTPSAKPAVHIPPGRAIVV